MGFTHTSSPGPDSDIAQNNSVLGESSKPRALPSTSSRGPGFDEAHGQGLYQF